MEDELTKYYTYLKGKGADVPPSVDVFRSTLQDEAAARKYYDYVKTKGFDAPPTFESFSTTFGLSAAPTPEKKSPDVSSQGSQQPYPMALPPSEKAGVPLEKPTTERYQKLVAGENPTEGPAAAVSSFLGGAREGVFDLAEAPERRIMQSYMPKPTDYAEQFTQKTGANLNKAMRLYVEKRKDDAPWLQEFLMQSSIPTINPETGSPEYKGTFSSTQMSASELFGGMAKDLEAAAKTEAERGGMNPSELKALEDKRIEKQRIIEATKRKSKEAIRPWEIDEVQKLEAEVEQINKEIDALYGDNKPYQSAKALRELQAQAAADEAGVGKEWQEKGVTGLEKQLNEYRAGLAEDIKTEEMGVPEFTYKALMSGIPVSPEAEKSRWSTYGQTGGYMVPMLAGEAIGVGVFKAPPGLTTSLIASQQAYTSGYDEAIAAGAPPSEAARDADNRALIALSEGVPMAGLFKKLDRITGGTATKSMLSLAKSGKYFQAAAQGAKAAGTIGKAATMQGIEGSLQEMGVEIANNMSSQQIWDATRQLDKGVYDAGEIGFVLDFFMGGIGASIKTATPADAAKLKEAESTVIDWAKTQLEAEKSALIEKDRLIPRDEYKRQIAEIDKAIVEIEGARGKMTAAPTQQATLPKPEAEVTEVTAEPEVTSVTSETVAPEAQPPTIPAEEISSTEISTPTTEEVAVEQQPVVPSQRTTAPPESAPFSPQEQRLIDEAMAAISAPRESVATEPEVAATEESVTPEVQPIEQPVAEVPITPIAPPPAPKQRVAAPPKSADAQRIQQHFPSTPREAAMKYFLEGGKVSEADALRYSPTGISEELKGTGYISKTQRSGLDKIAEQIQEQYPHLDEQEVTQAIGELIGTPLQDMRTEILEPYRKLESAEQQMSGAETELAGEEIALPDEVVERPSDVPFQEGRPSGVPVSRKQVEASVRMLGAMADTWAKVMGRSREDLLKRISISPDKKTFLIADERGVKGAYRKMADAHVVGLFAEADPSTPIHEFAHIGESLLREMAEADPNWKRKLNAVESWAGARNGKWTKAAREKFARAFENYARTNILPEGAPSALRKAFDVIRDFMHKVYSAVKGSEIDVRISPEVRAVFDEMLGLEAGSTTRGKQTQPSVAEFKTTGRVAEEFDSIPAGNLTARRKFDNKIAKNAYADLRDITRNFERIMSSISDKISQACP